MATKVKGDAIKDGSIPLSALATEVKNKIENAGGADWSAAKGEAGYIENKPITKKFIKEQSMEFSDVDEWESIYEGYEVVPSNTTVARVFVDITTDGGEHITTTVIVKNGSYVNILENDEENYLEISMHDTSDGCTISLGASLLFSGTLKCYYYEEFKQLDEDYIPDTVLKTTPQTLSDVDKNQALTNLGIDPVVWKYICNPVIIEHGNKVPEELIGEYSDDVGESGGYYLKYPNLAMYKIKIANSRIDSEYGNSDTNVILSPSDVGEYGLDLYEVYISKDYGVYAGGVCIDENKKWYFI
jgi:hypothetical protein